MKPTSSNETRFFLSVQRERVARVRIILFASYLTKSIQVIKHINHIAICDVSSYSHPHIVLKYSVPEYPKISKKASVYSKEKIFEWGFYLVELVVVVAAAQVHLQNQLCL